jgi:hypothetical protein
MKRFVGVDVPETGEESLIKKRRLDHPISLATQSHKIIYSNFERLRTKVHQPRLPHELVVGKEAKAAKAAVVVKSQVQAAGVLVGSEVKSSSCEMSTYRKRPVILRWTQRVRSPESRMRMFLPRRSTPRTARSGRFFSRPPFGSDGLTTIDAVGAEV